MTPPAPALIGIDIGTGSVKAVLLGADGARLDATARPHPIARPAPGHVEQAPEDWMARVDAALARFAAHPAAAGVAAIGITSQVNTHVFCDAALAPLMPAITWADVRAAAAGATLDAAISAEDRTAALGAPIPIDASHALARMAWMRDARPDLWARTAHVLLPRDYALARLTGTLTADALSAVGLAGPDLAYAAAILALLPGAGDRLPPLSDPCSVAGHVAAGPFAGTPVVTGTMDALASMFGLGVARPGQAMYLSGTSEVVALVCADRGGAPGVVTFPEWAGITVHAGPTQAGGAALDWVARLTGHAPAAAATLAERTAVSASSPLFLPHLEGERAPLWDAAARGTFAGLTGATGPAEMVAAVMEGVAFAARLALEAVERAGGGARIGTLNCGGGGAASDVWCRIRADALGRTLVRMAATDAGAVGAAVLAGAGAGLMPALDVAAHRLVREDRRFAPDPERAALADHRFALFRDLYEAAKPVNHALAAR